MILLLLYPLSLAACVLTLSLWFYYQQKSFLGKVLRGAFFLSLLVYLLAWLLHAGDWNAKTAILVRDLIILGAVPAVLSFLKNRSVAFFLLLGAAAAGLGWYLQGTSFYSTKQPADSGFVYPEEGEWELLVELHEGAPVEQLQERLKEYGLLFVPAFTMEHPDWTELDDFYAVEIPENLEGQTDQIVQALEDSGLVDWVEDNESVSVAPLPERKLPKVNKKFGLNDPGLEFQWGLEATEADQWYAQYRAGKLKPVQKALVAILDTGIDVGHEDLKGRLVSTRSEYDRDVQGHGTHCAGIAGAISNNGLGVASLIPSDDFIALTSIKVLNDYGMGTQRQIINGMLEAADRGAAVISMSLGGRSSPSKQRAYRQAVQYANRAGAIVVVAAGNNGSDARQIAPANTTGVIVVSAVDTLLNRASFSNQVDGLKMGVAAPGVAIYSTIPGGKYASFNGTSMATPYVAGVLGLMKSLRPDLNTEQAFELLNRTGSRTGNTLQTGKLVMPAAALQQLQEMR